MKAIGLLGGMSWESTLEYYRIINHAVGERLGGLHSADIRLHSFDFAPLEALLRRDDWDGLAQRLSAAAQGLVSSGAECIVIATNTMHNVAAAVEAAVPVPLIHIADATGAEIRRRGLSRVALLGTRFTMEKEFYRARLEGRFGVEVLVPDAEDRATVNTVIFGELCRGVVSDTSRRRYLEIIGRLRGRGAEAVALGCTEIPLLIGPEHTNLPLLDTTRLHALAAVAFALGEAVE